MISTSRQASVSKKRREELLRAAEEAPSNRRSTYLDLANQIGRELEEYDAIRNGEIDTFQVREIDDLGEVLIKARLAKGWTQRQLAEALHVSEQMVQKDESRTYENAGLARIAEVADVLGYNLKGSLRPVHLTTDLWKPEIMSMPVSTGFPLEINSSRIIPTWAAPEIPSSRVWVAPGHLSAGIISVTQSMSSEIVSQGYYLGLGGGVLTAVNLLTPVGAVHGKTTSSSIITVPINKLSGAAS